MYFLLSGEGSTDMGASHAGSLIVKSARDLKQENKP
jgi:hypothetical protein